MERTITFIAEHIKREYQQVKDEIEIEINFPPEQQELAFDQEPNTAEH